MNKFLLLSLLSVCCFTAAAQGQFIRIDQAGYLPDDKKVAVAMAKQEISGAFTVRESGSKKVVFTGTPTRLAENTWGGKFTDYYALDLSPVTAVGSYYIEFGSAASPVFTVGQFPDYQEDLLFFMRQQRCGYNPYLDAVCHLKDGRSFYAPFPDGTYVDATGGWHDAGDQLKYLITASNATARIILAYELKKDKFADKVDAMGRPWPNGIPDVLDEAKWGLDWIHKLHPTADTLIHQVADDRDHRGFKLPEDDNADYGWGANSYRPAYFADGKPQGVGRWKSKATGVANIAGRSAAAMAMGYRVWKNDLHDNTFAEKCLKAALELYTMGKKQEGYQQGNSFGAPYRYNEDTWADDMEFAAAELYKATRKPSYLADAKRYAKLTGTDTWMEFDDSSMGEQMSRHYEKYPFTNVGHFALYPLVDANTKRELAGYYRSGIEKIVERAKTNPFGIGVPFLWCSNNLVVAFITQVHLYELMTGDMRYHAAMLAHRDWLLGRNPWGVSMFTSIPANGKTATDVHLPTVQILKKQVPGALVDGPIDSATYKGLLGLTLTHPDEFADLQPDAVVYHDDVGDYSTNEPTIDGTADAILIMAMFSKPVPGRNATIRKLASAGGELKNPSFNYDLGAITRGDQTRRKLALVFTGDEFGDGVNTIAQALKKRGIHASFFFTGRFYRNPQFADAIKKLKADGNYLGSHSDQHLLYADWNDRGKTLVTKDEFVNDLEKSFNAMKTFGIERKDASIFLPPYEWHNQTIADWTKEIGLTLVNFTPGTRSNADYTTPDDKAYITSDSILSKIKEYESKSPNGLNGFILLMHAGTDPARTDKFYDKLDQLIVWLRSKNYEMVRVDELLAADKRPISL